MPRITFLSIKLRVDSLCVEPSPNLWKIMFRVWLMGLDSSSVSFIISKGPGNRSLVSPRPIMQDDIHHFRKAGGLLTCLTETDYAR